MSLILLEQHTLIVKNNSVKISLANFNDDFTYLGGPDEGFGHTLLLTHDSINSFRHL